jgi:hypothetical protein
MAFGFVSPAPVAVVTARHPLFTSLVWNAEADALLPTMSDRAVAKLVGVHRKTVAARRRQLGIPLHKPPHVWTAVEDALLGTMSDAAVGRQLNLNTPVVWRRRHRLGVPAWHQPKLLHQRRCVVCGRTFVVVGGRLSQMRKTCPPTHRITRSGRLSDHHKQLISATLKITGNQPTRKLSKVGASRRQGRGAVGMTKTRP